MYHRKIRCLLLSFVIFSFPLLAFASKGLTLFDNEIAAQNHCPQDEVVWLNLPTGIWHLKGGRWFGNTKHGAYVCEKEAATTGNRASLNE